VDSLQTRDAVMLGDRRLQLHRLDRLGVDHLPFTPKVLLENLLRHEDGQLVTAQQVEAVRRWDPTAERRNEVDLHPTRAFLHDTNGVPTLVDLAAMRDALAAVGGDPQAVNPVIPAELVTDHSVIADVFGRPDARDRPPLAPRRCDFEQANAMVNKAMVNKAMDTAVRAPARHRGP
jgi:aconitate hydratase